MSGRKRSGFEDLVAVAAKLPWWVALALAVVSYAVLHAFASVALDKPPDLEGFGAFAGGELLRVLASFGQYVLPAAFVIGAVGSAVARIGRRKLLSVSGDAGAGQVGSLDWHEFEMLVGEAFRQQGFRVRETAAGADGGVDLEMRKGTELHLVQCKHWRAQKVGVSVVRELYGVMAARGAAGGFVVTAGNFTKDAESFAVGRNIVLIGGDRLPRMLEAARASMSKHTESGQSRVDARPRRVEPAWDATAGKTTATTAPACPVCGGPMARRTARRGSNAGKDFWGCTAHPSCKGTRSVG